MIDAGLVLPPHLTPGITANGPPSACRQSWPPVACPQPDVWGPPCNHWWASRALRRTPQSCFAGHVPPPPTPPHATPAAHAGSSAREAWRRHETAAMQRSIPLGHGAGVICGPIQQGPGLNMHARACRTTPSTACLPTGHGWPQTSATGLLHRAPPGRCRWIVTICDARLLSPARPPPPQPFPVCDPNSMICILQHPQFSGPSAAFIDKYRSGKTHNTTA